ncbi:MAG: hypothetical protein ACRCUE_17370, partial [Bosea sp. (in: a-proteobacteria)]
MAHKPEQPRAFRLEPAEPLQAELKALDTRVEVVAEAVPAEVPEPLLETDGKRSLRWAWVLFTGLGGLASVSLFLWAQNAVIAA